MRLCQGREKKRQGVIQTCEFFAVDGFAASAVSSREITALKHEAGDDTMEGGSLVAISVLACG
jgi:hypothetical protein